MNKKVVPVYMYSLGVFIMVLTGHNRVIQGQENCQVPGSSSSICSTLDLQGDTFNISGLEPGQQVPGCLCDLKFEDSSYVDGPITIHVTANIPAGCQHEVYFIHNSTTMRYSCKVFELMNTFNVSVQDNLQMILVSGERAAGGFQFCFKISTEPELNMHLVCNETNTTGMIPSTTTEIMSETTVPTTTTTTELMPETTVPSTSNTTELMPDTTVSRSTLDERVTDQNTNPSSTNQNGDIVQTKLDVIIGGCVGGLTVIIVIVIIIVWVKNKRRKDKTGGDHSAVTNKDRKNANNNKRNEQFKIGPSDDQYAKQIKKNEAGKQFKMGPSGDQYAVVNKGGNWNHK